jgi:NAD(P)H-hydrate epimerase
MRSSWPLVDAEGMRRRDRHTIETLGVPGELLMEVAGRAVASEALALGAARRGALVVCGPGNNGGDGLVAARHLHLLGVRSRVVLLADEAALTGDAAANAVRARRARVSFVSPEVLEAPRAGEIWIDAIFGTGLGRAPRGLLAAAIEAASRARRERGCPLLAVDLPSGLCADTGQALGACVEADRTVTLGLPKLGLLLEPGRSLAGVVRVARIGIADTVPGDPEPAACWTWSGAAQALPARPAAGHKGSFGHVLVVAGSQGKSGAAALAALGAERVGAGLVTIACAGGLHDILEVKCTEAMTVPVSDANCRSLSPEAEKQILELALARDVVALGPGLGTDPGTVALVRSLAVGLARPLVLDADALNALADDPARLKRRTLATIVTPHPGEASRLLGCESREINADRIGRARALADRTGAVVVLKGAPTVTAAPDGRVLVNTTGGPLLGTGGTGDVLTGTIAGLLAQGKPAFEAAALGAHLHGLAADLLAARTGPAGSLASEVAGTIPEAMQHLRQRAAADREGEQAGGGEREDGLSLSFPGP